MKIIKAENRKKEVKHCIILLKILSRYSQQKLQKYEIFAKL